MLTVPRRPAPPARRRQDAAPPQGAPAPATAELGTTPQHAGRLPNLLVIGTQKAGTTWLHKRLSEHPSILMSTKKEVNLFGDARFEARLDEYRANFPVTPGKLLYGESTPGYFWTPGPDDRWCDRYLNSNRDIPGSVLRTLGDDVRLIVSLRHPVTRAVSAMFHHFRRGRTVAGDRLPEVGRKFGIIDIGFYARHWRVWANTFGENGPIVVLFDTIVRDADGTMAAVLDRLGLAPAGPTSPEADHAGFKMRIRDGVLEIDPDVPANRKLAARWKCDIAHSPRIHEEDLASMDALYREDIEFCQARWCDGAGVDWTAPRRLEDLLTER